MGVIPDRREPYRRVPLGRVHLDERRLDEVLNKCASVIVCAYG